MKGYRQSNPGPPSTSGRLTSNPANGGGPQAWRGGAIGCSPDFRSRALRATVTRGFGGKMAWGATGSLPTAKCGGERLYDGSHQWLPSFKYRRWWAVAPALFRLQEAAQRLPHGLLLLLGRFNGSNRQRLGQIWWQLGFGRFQALWAKIWAMRCAIHKGF
jgi:hypothetical protein